MDFDFTSLSRHVSQPDLASLSRYISLKNILFTLCGLALVKYRGYLYWPIRSWQSPLRNLNGPKNNSLFLGHITKIADEEGSNIYEEWTEKYGKTFRYRGLLGSYQLYTSDMTAVHYIMTHPNIFRRLETAKLGMEIVLGKGIMTADLETHKKQRRILNPSFGPLQIQSLVPIFMEKANKLRDAWIEMIDNKPKCTDIDVLSWIDRATLDIIGSAGFGHEFDSLQKGGQSKLTELFNITPTMFIELMLHYFLRFPIRGGQELDACIGNMRRIGKQLLADKKTIIQNDGDKSTELQGRDLLTLLLKSNMAAEEGARESQTMSEEEVLGQISTFLVAGHETSSTTIAWALYALTQHPKAQTRLRHELQNARLGDEPSMPDLDKLPYLDCVVRETLRIHAAVVTVERETTADVVVPVGEEYIDKNGVIRKEIRMQKGDALMIPILAMNRAKDVWGEDAMEFRPERWNDLPEGVKEMPGVWGNIMTFSVGSHSCIGFRFAILEIKAILYSLIRSIEFTIDPQLEIEGKAGVISVLPCVKSTSKEGNRLPLTCKLLTIL